MDVITNAQSGVDLPSFLQPPDLQDCGPLSCPNCEVLKDRLKKLSYCLAVAQRLSDVEV